MAGVPGTVLEQPWQDFSTSRNALLRAHANATGYALMVDADHVMTDLWRLRIVCRRLLTECRRR